jgi:hypothetical protein
VPEADHGGDHEGAADVGDIEALDAGGGLGEAEDAGEFAEVGFGVDGDREFVGDALEFLGLLGGPAEVGDGVAELGGFFEVEARRRPSSPASKPAIISSVCPARKVAGGLDLGEVLVAGDVGDAGGGAVLEVAVEAVAVVGLGGVRGRQPRRLKRRRRTVRVRRTEPEWAKGPK